MRIHIDASEVRQYTERLKNMRKFDLPVVVNQTLNSLAYDVKKRTLQVSAQKEFTLRTTNLFKAISKVTPSKGFNIHLAKSTVGVPLNQSSDSKKDVAKNLVKQEVGGVIGKRSYLSSSKSRTRNSMNKNVRSKYRMKRLGITTTSTGVARVINSKDEFYKKVHEEGVGGIIRYKSGVFEVVKLPKRGKVGLKFLYSYKPGRSVRIKKATRFLMKASMMSSRNSNMYYKQHANKRFKKYFG